MTTKTLKTLIVPLLMGLGCTAGAQTLADYTFAHDTVDFESIAGTPGAHTDTWGYGQQDDGTRTLQMPFGFPFGESTIDSGSNVIMSANGYLQFGLIAMGSYASTAYTTTSSQYKAIVPYINTDGYCNGNLYWADTVDGDGRRVLVAEYRGVTTYSARTSPEAMNYQIRLYADGTIEVVYDTSDFDAPANHTLFVANGYGDRLCLTGSWAAAQPGTPAQLPSLDGVPAPGTRYTLTRPAGFCSRPQALSVDSAATDALLLSWTGTAAGYTLFYSDNDTAWTDSIGAIEETAFLLGGLAAQTTYRIAVRSDCAEGLASTLSPAVTATTACGAVGTAQMPYTEGFEAYSSYQFNPCWTRLYRENDQTLNTAYPTVVYQSTGNSTHNIKFSAQNTSGGRWTIAVLPEFEAPLADLQLSFTYALGDTADAWISVGTMTDPTDTATFEPYDTVHHTAAAYTWDTAEVSFGAYGGGGARIAIRFSTTAQSQYLSKSMWMDDVAVMYTPSCTRPQSVTVDTVGTDFAELTVVDSESGATYEVSYWIEGSADTLSQTTTGTFIGLSGLQQASLYNVSICKLCTDGTRTLSIAAQLTTACDGLTHADLPYSEDFNSYEAWNGAPINPCWTIVNLNTAGPYPYPSMYANHSGLNGNALYMYADSDGKGQYVSLPQMDDLSDLGIRFFTKAQNTACRIEVGVMTDPTDTATFSTLYTVVPQSTTAWEEHVVNLGAYEGEGRHVAFRNSHVSLTSYAIYLDDITLDYATDCPHPLGIELAGATESTLDVTIADTASVGSYRLWIAADGDTTSIDIADTAYTLSGLESGTHYTVTAAALCNGTESETVSADAWTLCTIRPASELPLSESFEGWEANIHADLGACWQAHYGTDSAEMSTYAKVYATADYDNGGRHAVKMMAQHSYTTGEQYSTLVLPQFDANPRMLQLDVKLRFAYQYAPEGEYVEAGILADPSDPQTFTPCTLVENPGNYQYHEYTARFGRFQGNSGAVALRYHYNVANDYAYIMVDSVSLTLMDEEDVPCDVTELSLTDTTDSSATIGWSYNCAIDSFEVRLTGADEDRTLFTDQTQVTFTALEPATSYSVRVRHVGSFWSQDLYFTTADTTAPVVPVDTTTIDTTTTTDTTSITSAERAMDIAIAPNPAATGQTVTVAGMPEGATLTLMDAAGRMVLRQRGHTIATAQLRKGIYFVSIGSDGQTCVRKLVIR